MLLWPRVWKNQFKKGRRENEKASNLVSRRRVRRLGLNGHGDIMSFVVMVLVKVLVMLMVIMEFYDIE